ncbi:MAG TPA: cytochrome c-type biogenesis protein [Steroidobacteraceae bacterium]|nr:cytochrome c-type biogenesis protein [Steroidobacteraceae bacterium]
MQVKTSQAAPGRSGWLALIACALLGAAAAWAIDPTELPDPKLQARYLALTHELRCMQCQNQSIADSPVGLASDLRREVRDMLVAGKSDEDVRNFMVARYGEFILFRPRFSARNAWLWFGPVVLLALGCFVAIRILRQRAALLPQDTEPVDEDLRS